MKWFFALNANGNQFAEYAEMLKTAVYTAQKFTSLEPYFLYDGGENALTEWLRERNVEIINCRTFLYDSLSRIAEKRNDPNYLNIGAGAFLRTEIPRLTEKLGFTDEFVLYTDIDVIFLKEIVGEISAFKPKYFAVAPEFFMHDYLAMNSGVMVMNLKNLRAKDDEFRSFMREKIDLLVDHAWDQGAYKMFYQSRFLGTKFDPVIKRVFGFKWDKLPHEYNWKPYWGANANAKIVHFHGPKPYQKELLTSKEPPPHLVPLLHLVGPAYLEFCRLWDEFHQAANA